MKDIIAQLIGGMTIDEKRELFEALRAAIAADLAGWDAGERPTCCPRCGYTGLVKKGHNADGAQRWMCKSCGATFCAGTMSLIGQSKLPPETWARFAWCLVARKSLRECARDCGVCLRTAWYMRIRACEVMSRSLEKFRTEGTRTEADGTFLNESLKGNRTRPNATPMPRKPRRNGKLHVRGISNLKVCVVCAANDLGDSFAAVAARGRAGSADLTEVLDAAGVGEGTRLATDGHRSYAGAVAALRADWEALPSRSAEARRSLALVNALHDRIKAFLRPFYGVSSKWLQHYLWWFRYADQFVGGDASREERLAADQVAGHYELTRRAAIEAPQPFWDFWEGEVPEGA